MLHLCFSKLTMKYKKIIIKIQSFTDQTYIVLYLQLTPENEKNYFALIFYLSYYTTQTLDIIIKNKTITKTHTKNTYRPWESLTTLTTLICFLPGVCHLKITPPWLHRWESLTTLATLICFLPGVCHLKITPPWLHRYGLSPVCVIKWAVR